MTETIASTVASTLACGLADTVLDRGGLCPVVRAVGVVGVVGVVGAGDAVRVAWARVKCAVNVGAWSVDMWLFVLEALLALVILVAIVWWTMFAGRAKGERQDTPPTRDDGRDRP